MSYEDPTFDSRFSQHNYTTDGDEHQVRFDDLLGDEASVGFAVVVHEGHTLVIPLHNVRTQIHHRTIVSRHLVRDRYFNPKTEIRVRVQGITDQYRVYDGTPEDFVNGTSRPYTEDREQAELEVREQREIEG